MIVFGTKSSYTVIACPARMYEGNGEKMEGKASPFKLPSLPINFATKISELTSNLIITSYIISTHQKSKM